MQKTLEFENGRQLAALYGANDANLQILEKGLGVKIVVRDNIMVAEGKADALVKIEIALNYLRLGKQQGMTFKSIDLQHLVTEINADRTKELDSLFQKPAVIQLKAGTWIAKTLNQKRYIQAIRAKEIVFGVGPAGTGKTYLAMALAMEALQHGTVKKVILTRPAVEAGEALGFLPGELDEKLSPYLRPLYDAMEEMIGKEAIERFMEKGIIEIAPLAYMRGRTLTGAFVVLDEAQNTTPEQMMMFLTRIGEGTRMVITGDVTQIDLPRSKISGLKQAIDVLSKVGEIELFYFSGQDVVRHPLVQKIIEAYEAFKEAHLR